MAEMSLDVLIKPYLLIFSLVLLATDTLGVDLRNGNVEETKIRSVPGTIPQTLSIENLHLEGSRRTKPTKEPLTASLTTTPPTPTSSTVIYRLNGDNGKACILIRTDALLSFKYYTKLGEEREGDVYVPERYEANGECNDDTSYITIAWKKYTWTVYFSKTPGGERWYVDKMQVTADTGEPALEHVNRPERTLRFTTSKEHSMLYPTPIGKAYTCEQESSVELVDRDVKVTVMLRELKLQPFIFKKDDFGPEFICSPGAKSYRDETAPIAVGSTLAIVTLLTVTGYGIYRYMKIKKVQYDTME